MSTNTNTKANKPMLTLRRVRTGKHLYEGWALTLDFRRKPPMFLGEEQVSKFLSLDTKKRTQEASDKITSDKSPLANACRKLSDFPHLLAIAYELCVKHGYRPCKVIRDFGAGAKAKIMHIDAIRKNASTLKARVAKATDDFVKAGKSGKVSAAAVEALATASAEYDKYNAEVVTPETAKYRKEALVALALVSRMTDFYDIDCEKRN